MSGADGLERQLSWALPQLPSAASSTYTWGRSDLGQTGSGRDQNSTAPELLQALRGKDVVHAAGASYNSAFVTSVDPPSLHTITHAPWHCCATFHSTFNLRSEEQEYLCVTALQQHACDSIWLKYAVPQWNVRTIAKEGGAIATCSGT